MSDEPKCQAQDCNKPAIYAFTLPVERDRSKRIYSCRNPVHLIEISERAPPDPNLINLATEEHESETLRAIIKLVIRKGRYQL